MPARGWTTITLKDDLVALIDSFVAQNKLGYSNRAEVVAAAVRTFVQHHAAPTVTEAQIAVAVAKYMQGRDDDRRKPVRKGP